ncbi:hypothetical protein BG61_16695 [Caballeronia glathei]|uniref:Uncharacterized protein n=1 Tax=Caballeronia glathei TaxID=60547 RepID=A0A069PLM4_9BURK|nr:hypothetical protein BG61_16695 [Caballeronia glathei]
MPFDHCRELFELLQLGMLNAVGAALEPVAFASTVFAATGERPEIGIEIFGALRTPVTVRVGTVSGPFRTPPDSDRTFENALLSCAAVRI